MNHGQVYPPNHHHPPGYVHPLHNTNGPCHQPCCHGKVFPPAPPHYGQPLNPSHHYGFVNPHNGVPRNFGPLNDGAPRNFGPLNNGSPHYPGHHGHC